MKNQINSQSIIIDDTNKSRDKSFHSSNNNNNNNINNNNYNTDIS